MTFNSENKIFNQIAKSRDPNKSLKELGEKLEWASSELISESKLLIVIENFMNRIYKNIKKDNKFPNITEQQMRTFLKMLAEAKNLNYHKKQKTLNPELFEMARALGEKMITFSGKLKTISIPLIVLAEAINNLPN